MKIVKYIIFQTYILPNNKKNKNFSDRENVCVGEKVYLPTYIL